MAHNLAHKYPTLASANRLHMYSFGAPRVGNTQFCEDYNAMLGHAAFRIVNNADVVPRCVGACHAVSCHVMSCFAGSTGAVRV